MEIKEEENIRNQDQDPEPAEEIRETMIRTSLGRFSQIPKVTFYLLVSLSLNLQKVIPITIYHLHLTHPLPPFPYSPLLC